MPDAEEQSRVVRQIRLLEQLNRAVVNRPNEGEMDFSTFSEGYNYDFDPELARTLERIVELEGYEPPVRIQSIQKISKTRRIKYVVHFSFGEDQGKLRRFYIAENPGKEIYLPHFMNLLGIKTVKSVGINPDATIKGYAYPLLLAIERGITDTIGFHDYKDVVEILSPDYLIHNAGKCILDLMARMHVLGTQHLPDLEHSTGFSLEGTVYQRIMWERLIQHLNPSLMVGQRLPQQRIREFLEAVRDFARRYFYDQQYFCHGDFTANNLRVEGDAATIKLTNPMILDFELSTKNGCSLFDLVTFAEHTLQIRPDRVKIKEDVRGGYSEVYFVLFEDVARQEKFPCDIKLLMSKVEPARIMNQLYRVGDQIMMQEKYMKSGRGIDLTRVGLASWYLTEFHECSEKLMRASHLHEKRLVERLRDTAYTILKNYQNIYFQVDFFIG